jgi:hypothetical protein
MKTGVTPVTHQDRGTIDAAKRVENQAHRAVQWMWQGQLMAHHRSAPLLVRYFVRQCARCMHKTIDTIAFDTMQGLMRYAWSSNPLPRRPASRGAHMWA